MNPLNPFFSIFIYLIAFLTAYLIKLKYKINSSSGRYECIDGMRGFLALGVFIHHASIWYQYVQNGSWEAPQSNLYNQLGGASVSLFFMITSFLFISKLLNSAEKGFNFRDFFISRLFRLVPMYYVSVFLIVFFVMIISHWHLNTDILEFIKSIIRWLLFTIVGSPINNSDYTNLIIAGVVWSLPYELLVYFSLPLISLLILKVKPSVTYIILSIIFIILFYKMHGIVQYYIYSFIGGAIAPFLLKYTSVNKKIKQTYASVIIIICLFLIVQFHSSNNVLCIILIAVIFTLIALGNSLFGILKNSTLKFLGEISYTTYLIHGIVLFSVFYFGFGLENVKILTPFVYCLIIFSITPFVVLFSFLGFRYIEKPFMDKSKILIQKLNDKSEGENYSS